MTFIEIANVNDLPVGRARACGSIALYRTGSGVFASTNTCPHRGGPLGEGDLLGNEIVCPWHFWSFDVTTGKNCADPSLTIQTYEVKIENDRVLVRLS